MKRTLVAFAVALMGLSAAPLAAAQTVYRCGPEGRVYSQTPCPQGRAVDVSDPRTAAQRADAQALARADAARAERLAQERRAEAQRPAPKPGHINARPAPVVVPPHVQPVRKKRRHARRPPDADFRAVAPKSKNNTRKKKPASAG